MYVYHYKYHEMFAVVSRVALLYFHTKSIYSWKNDYLLCYINVYFIFQTKRNLVRPIRRSRMEEKMLQLNVRISIDMFFSYTSLSFCIVVFVKMHNTA